MEYYAPHCRTVLLTQLLKKKEKKKKAFYLSFYTLTFGISFLCRATKEMLEERPLKHA